MSGGAGIGATPGLPFPRPTVPGTTGKIIHGLAYAPADAPLQVQEVIWAGDRIRFKPYVYAGGHGRWNDVGYDCSGTVSYVLHAAGMLKVSMDSSQFETLGQAWRRSVDHGLHESGARVHRGRRNPTRHLGRAGSASGVGHRPKVAAGDDEHDWIHGPAPGRVLALKYVRSPVHRGAGDVRAGARPRYA